MKADAFGHFASCPYLWVCVRVLAYVCVHVCACVQECVLRGSCCILFLGVLFGPGVYALSSFCLGLKPPCIAVWFLFS